MTALERVIETYQRGQGVAHQVDHPNSVRGLLTDQVAVSEALYDAYRATDRDVYLDLAQELMLFAMRALWNARVGAFVDRVVATDDVGLLRPDNHAICAQLPSRSPPRSVQPRRRAC